jgi:hypothetical protein
MPKSKMANRGKSAIWPVIEKELMPWVNDHRQQELSGFSRCWLLLFQQVLVIVASAGNSNVSGV